MDLPWIKAFMESRRTEADKIQADWSQELHRPSEAEIKRASLLAWEGHLTSVECMRIKDTSITDIPLDHMEKLASVVTGTVNINMMNHADHLSSILASVKCKVLWLNMMELTDAETRALVTAMRDRVQFVRFWYYGCGIEIRELLQYDGQGRCSWIELGVYMRIYYEKKLTRWAPYYEKKLTRWAADKGWTIKMDNDGGLVMKRK